MTFQLEESDRQMILLGLSELAVARPGFAYAIGLVAAKLHGQAMVAEFSKYSPLRERLAGNTALVKRHDRQLRELHSRHNKRQIRLAKVLSLLAECTRVAKLPDALAVRIDTELYRAAKSSIRQAPH